MTSDLSCFRIVTQDGDSAFYIHAYSSSARRMVEVDHHWAREDAEFDLAKRCVGGQIRAIAGVREELFRLIGTVVDVGRRVTVTKFGGKHYSCPTVSFSHYFQSCVA